ncbi:DUF29 family protein [Candidatus Entotheonella palauensis]|uniref:DUF29 domain-containing protein n=1 Tax=Candidatus Entotheonella gemina TaxID=1429439 RepID=W4MF34_9BACT|nr:DUF29 family protein [Candidatus Entotheonella palauensis]ETX08546.1 MAG: hypothetical protein ETSY2_04750 [Candidatus Entotheonella gemina]
MRDRLALTVCQDVEANHTADLEEWIDKVSRSDRSALESYLMRLMQHVIKWKVQPERRSRSWRNTIYNSRNQIQRLQQKRPSLNRQVIEHMWDQVLHTAQQEAEKEIQRTLPPQLLTWQEVFEDVYTFEG